jgi:hypothetical protein
MDLQQIPKLAEWIPMKYVSSGLKEASSPEIMVAGSFNMMLTGNGKTQVFKGMALIVGQNGGIVMMNVAEDYASLGQVSDVTAYGNAFNVFSALMYIGKGLLRLSGVSLAENASATLSLLIKHNGSYTDPLSGPWQAGLAQPSAPAIFVVNPPPGFTGKVNGVVSVVIWRIRSTTGAVSIHSDVSNIVAATNQSIAIPFPLPDANGQDYWGVGVTLNAEGRVGSHFELVEIPESEVSEKLNRSDIVTNAASLNITSATGGFTSDHIGWKVTLSGGAPACALISFVTGVPDANTLTLNAMPPTTSTGVSLLLERGVQGSARTIVVEWRDGDLVGKLKAPDRDFAPPEALFAGSLQDQTFVDGAYADAETLTSNTNRGTAIAPSEHGKPESFSPDTVIFTNDTPTALLRGDEVYWRVCLNSVYVMRSLGDISVEPVWQGIGVQYQHNAVLGEGGRLYLWPSRRGPVRMNDNGLADGTFANDIADDLVDCTDPAKRVLGYYDDLHVVVFCYEKKVWPLFTDLGSWGAPADLTGKIAGNIRSAVTVNRLLYLADDLDNIYKYDVGTGSIGIVRTGWQSSAGGMDTIATIVAAVRADNNTQPVTIDLFADGDDTSPVSSFSVTPSRSGYTRLPAVWPNEADCESHAVQVTIESTTASGDCGLESIQSFGPSNNSLR